MMALILLAFGLLPVAPVFLLPVDERSAAWRGRSFSVK
jgi:hypothetical protein